MRKLLDILPRRGPEAFQIFIKVLQDTNNDHVALKLKSGISPQNNSHHRQEDGEDDLPQSTLRLYYDLFLHIDQLTNLIECIGTFYLALCLSLR